MGDSFRRVSNQKSFGGASNPAGSENISLAPVCRVWHAAGHENSPKDNDMSLVFNPVTLTKELVAIPSESSSPLKTDIAEAEKAMAVKLQELFRAAGVASSLQDVLPGRQNVIARFPRPGAPRLMITGHMDTVSARMEAHGFSPVVEDGKLFGRGACDDKGPLAAAICAILNRRGGTRYDLTFLATVGEEDGMHGAKVFARETAGDAPFDLILALEPTRLKPITAHKGAFRFKITTDGKSCHSSEPWNGINAIDRMMPVIENLNAYGASLSTRHCPRTGFPTLAITRINGGKAVNIIPDACEITVDMRTVPGLSDQEIQEAVAGICADNARMEVLSTYRALRGEPSGPVWDAFEDALRSASLDCRQESAKYCTDCSFLQTLGPCVVWGPGDIAQAHTANEFIELSQLNGATAVLAAFLG
jgi:acetylornithine deacetylase